MSDQFVSNTVSLLHNIPANANPVVLNTGLKRPSSITGVDQMIDAIVQPVMNKALKSAPGIARPLQSGLPAEMRDSVNVISTEFSTLDAQTDEVIVNSIMARPYAEGWHRGFTEFMALFCNRMEPLYTEDGTHTLASVPLLNYFFEQRSILDSQKGLLRHDFLPDSSAIRTRHEFFMAASPAEFARKWAHLGIFMTRQPGQYRASTMERRSILYDTQIGYSQYGRAYTFNLFGQRVRRGDRLYFVVREFPAESRDFIDPSGSVITGRANYPNSFLQIRGFTSSENDMVPMYAENETEVSIEYRRQAMRVQQEFIEYDYDEDGNINRKVDIRRQEGVQSAEDSVNQIVYEAYDHAHVMRVGIARAVKGEIPTLRQLLDAHRNQELMKGLQMVHLYNGL